jgi:hypothetical protein
MRFSVLVASLILSVLSLSLFEPASAFSFSRRVSESISATCESVRYEFAEWSNDTVIWQLNSEFQTMPLCHPEFRLWFWQSVDLREVESLRQVQWLGSMRVHMIKKRLEVRRKEQLNQLKSKELALQRDILLSLQKDILLAFNANWILLLTVWLLWLVFKFSIRILSGMFSLLLHISTVSWKAAQVLLWMLIRTTPGLVTKCIFGSLDLFKVIAALVVDISLITFEKACPFVKLAAGILVEIWNIFHAHLWSVMLLLNQVISSWKLKISRFSKCVAVKTVDAWLLLCQEIARLRVKYSPDEMLIDFLFFITHQAERFLKMLEQVRCMAAYSKSIAVANLKKHFIIFIQFAQIELERLVTPPKRAVVVVQQKVIPRPKKKRSLTAVESLLEKIGRRRPDKEEENPSTIPVVETPLTISAKPVFTPLYTFVKTLGQGMFGKCYLVKSAGSETLLAGKCFDKKTYQKNSVLYAQVSFL